MGIIVYAVLALAVMGMIGTGVYKVKQWGGDEVRAELQPRVDAAEGRLKALAEETAQKQAQSAQALRKAEGRAKVWDDQAKRLTAILAARKPTDPQDCKAAWVELRK
jgi:nitric oxide reductase large subunit